MRCTPLLLMLAIGLCSTPFAATATAEDIPPKLENVKRIGADKTEALRKMLLQNKPALDAGLTATPGSPAWRQAEVAAAQIWAAGGADAPIIMKSLLKEGGARGLSASQGKLLWDIRKAWLYEGIRRVGASTGAHFAILDSGTEGSVSNDIDKTLRLIRGKPGFTEEMLVAQVNREVLQVILDNTRQNLTLLMIDIEHHNGRNFYPNWWKASDPATFKREVFRVYKELSSNPAAYVTDSAQKLQVLRRVQDKLEKLKRTGQAGAAVEEVQSDPQTGKVSITPMGENWMEVLSLSSQLEAHDAAGASLGNLLMLQHKIAPEHGAPLAVKQANAVKDDIAKYSTRNVLDTATAVDTIAGKPPKARYEPADFNTQQKRLALLSRMTGLAENDRRVAGYEMAMDISDKLLENKRRRSDNQPTIPDDLVFDKLAAYLADTPHEYSSNREHWQNQARLTYANLAKETSMAVLARHFNEVAKNWLEPDPKLIRRAQRIDPNLKNQNIRILAMALLAQAHAMSEQESANSKPGEKKPDPFKLLLAHVEPKYRNDVENLVRMLRQGSPKDDPSPSSKPPVPAAETRSLAQHAERMKGMFSSVGSHIGGLYGKLDSFFNVSEEDTWRWSLDMAFAHQPPAERERQSGKFLGEVENDHGRVLGLAQANTLRVMHSLASLGRPGTLLNFAQTWQQTEGLPIEVRRKAIQGAVVDELVGQIPVYGPVRGLYRSVEARDAQGFLAQIVPILDGHLMGSAGIAGPVIMYVDFSKKVVGVIGHEIFHPLRQDSIDLVYKGYMESSDAGLLRAGNKFPKGFQLGATKSILAYVPVHFAFLEGDTLDHFMSQLDQDPSVAARDAYIAIGKQMEQAAPGQPASILVDLDSPYDKWIPELQEEIHYLNGGGSDPEVRQYLDERAQALAQVLKQWKQEAAIAKATRVAMLKDPKLAFEISRQNLYRRFRNSMDTAFDIKARRGVTVNEMYTEFDREMEKLRQARWNLRAPTMAEAEARSQALDTAEANIKQRQDSYHQLVQAAYQKNALNYVEDWTQARGDFVHDEENIGLKWIWHDEETKQGIASRLADDYQASEQLTLAAQGHQQLLSQLKEVALQKVEAARIRRLAILARRAWVQPNGPDAQTWALALGEPPETPAELKLDVAVVESRDSEGKPKEDLVVLTKSSAVPQLVGENWDMSVPVIKEISPSALPASALGKTPRKDVTKAYVLNVALGAGDNRERKLIATAQHYLYTRQGTPAKPQAPAVHNQVPPLHLTAIEGDLTDPASRSGRKSFKTDEASGELVLALVLPDTIVPGKPFEMKATLQVSGQLKPGVDASTLKVKLGQAPAMPLTVQPGGRFSARIDLSEASAFKLFGPKDYEWNYLYSVTPSLGDKHQRIVRYQIGHDTPGGAQLNRTNAGMDADRPGAIPQFMSTRNDFTYDGVLSIGYHDQRIRLSAIYNAEGAPMSAASGKPPGTGDTSASVGGGNTGGAWGYGGLVDRINAQMLHPPGSGGAGNSGTKVPASPLAAPDPWNNPQIQQLIDDWLDHATPVMPAERPGPWHYSRWGQLMGPGITIAGAPNHPAGWTRYQSMFAVRAKFDSLNLCSMGEYIERRVAGRGTEGCQKAAPHSVSSSNVPATPVKPPPPISTERPPESRPPGRIVVQSAIYGPNCNTPADVTNDLVRACNSGNPQRCEYRVDHHVIGDPAIGCYKDYVYHWRCVGSDESQVHEGVVRGEASGKTASLICPAGMKPAIASHPTMPVAPSVASKRSRGLIDKVDAIPDNLWIAGKPNFNASNFRQLLVLAFVNYDPLILQCGKAALSKGITVVGFTPKNDLDYSRWPGMPPFPIAVSAKARDTLYAIEVATGRQPYLNPIPFGFGYLLDSNGRIVTSGRCTQLLGITGTSEPEKKK